MASFLEYDPLNGVTQSVDVTDDGRLQIHYEQDIEPVRDLAAANRAAAVGRNQFERIADDASVLYAVIPPVAQMEILVKYGVNIGNRRHWPELFKIINRDYPHLKTTNKIHTVKY